jgi:sulfur relay (sulfurtransferase) DsrC/TusE family protein
MSIHTSEAVALIHNRPGFAREVARQLGFTHVKEARTVPVLRGYGLTPKQKELLQFIRDYYHANGMTPTFEEMKVKMGLASKAGIHRMINGLEERGHIFRIPTLARSIILRESVDA